MADSVPNINSGSYRGLALGGPDNLHTAWRVLAGSAADAAASLVDVSQNSPVPGARVRASQLILEMVGFRAAETVQVLPPEHDQATVSGEGDTSAARIRARLETLGAIPAAPTAAPTLDQLATPPEPAVVDAVVDAELVDDQP